MYLIGLKLLGQGYLSGDSSSVTNTFGEGVRYPNLPPKPRCYYIPFERKNVSFIVAKIDRKCQSIALNPNNPETKSLNIVS